MAKGLAVHSAEVVSTHKDQLIKGFQGLMDSEAFIDAITYTTNGTKQVQSRFEMADNMFREVFDA